MTIDPAEAQRRRAARRRRLQQRQTLIFGILITALLAVALLAAAMWGNVIPSPFTRAFSAPEPAQAAYTVTLLIPGSTVSLDGRDDEVIDVVLGGSFDQVLDPETAGIDPEAPLTPPPGCTPVPEPDDEAEEVEGEETEVVTIGPDDDAEESETEG